MAAAGHGLLLVRRMALHLGGGALDAQQLGRQREAAAVVEVDLQHLLLLLEPDLGRPVLGREGLGRGIVLGVHVLSSSGRASSTRLIVMPARAGTADSTEDRRVG